ncbi:MAG TPA: hypothetical protein VGM12_10605 [Trebonia sp.]|jgi:hypothetical protein
MTASTTQPSLWDAPHTARRSRRQIPASCALCPARAETPFGLCLGCLRAAADELARIVSRPPGPDDGRLSSVPFAAICRRCGRPGHDPRACDA